MNKTDLIKGIAKELYDSEEAYSEINAVATEDNYEDVAERIVNKFFIQIVSERSELLFNFIDWYNEDAEKTPITEDEIELFKKEKLNNCC